MRELGPRLTPIRRWSAHEEAELCAMIAEEKTYLDCAEALGRTRGSVAGKFSRICEKMGRQAQ